MNNKLNNQLPAPSNIANLFPTALGIYKNDNHRETKKVLTEMMKHAPFQKNEECPSLIHYFDAGDSVLVKDELKFFRDWVEEKALNFATEVVGYSIDKLNVTDSWLNVSNKGAFQPPHMHVNSFISATYYVNKGKGHSPLIFIHPRNQNIPPASQIMSVNYSSRNLYQSDVPVDVEEGNLVIWESHLVHGYPPNESDNRISLSMNFMPSTVKHHIYSYKTVRR